MDVIVINKVAWSHARGINRTRLTYDQLSLTQWVKGFCRMY